MRSLWMITTIMCTTAGATAYAQGATPTTMDAQLEQMQASGDYVPPQQQVPSASAPAEILAPHPITPDGSVTTSSGTKVYQSMIHSEGNGAIPPVPLETQTNGQVTYLNGGISDEEMNMLKTHAGDYNLQIIMNVPSGQFMVASKFHILDSSGQEVLRVDDAGPYLYAKLSPGKYTVEAVENGEIKTANVNVPASGSTRIHLTFTQ
jgi:hypothetical protein